MNNKPEKIPYDKNKQHKTPEEKKEDEQKAIALFKFFREHLQGNITFPCYDGNVGKAKIEAFIDVSEASNIFKLGT